MQLVMQTVFGLQLVRMVESRTPKMVNSGSRSLLEFPPTSLDWPLVIVSLSLLLLIHQFTVLSLNLFPLLVLQQFLLQVQLVQLH